MRGIIPSPLHFEESTSIGKPRDGTYASQTAKSEHLFRKGIMEGEKRELKDEQTGKIKNRMGLD